MTNTTNTTAYDALVNDINSAQVRSNKESAGAADMAVHITRTVLDGEKGGNYRKLEGVVTRVSAMMQCNVYMVQRMQCDTCAT